MEAPQQVVTAAPAYHMAAPATTTFAAAPAVHHVAAPVYAGGSISAAYTAAPATTTFAAPPAVHHVAAPVTTAPVTTALAPAHSMVAPPTYDFAPTQHFLPSTPSMIAYPQTPFQFTA